jgi:lipopolysaccharide/colanic/teichoic acid biosynthesis glycosyltransferase
LRKKLTWYFVDATIVVLSFYLLDWLKFGYLQDTSRTLLTSVYTLALWIIVSIFTKKHDVLKKTDVKDVIADITISNIFILGSILVLVRLRQRFIEVRFLLIYVVVLASIIEFFAGWVIAKFNRIKNRPFQTESDSIDLAASIFTKPGETITETINRPPITQQGASSFEALAKIIREETDKHVVQFIEKYLTHNLTGTAIVSTTTRFNILNLPVDKYDVLINLKRLNDIKYVNKFFEAANSKLTHGGIFIAWVETYGMRKKRLLAKFPGGINYLIYSIDFLLKRVFPKLPITKNVYFFLTRGHNRVLSKAETFGRLYSCGFKIVEEAIISDQLFFVVRKTKEPVFDNNPTYGPLIRLQRIGMHGKIIGVYKIRTMHAYSEYLQDYIYNRSKLQPGGKFKDDFRITTLGRIFRTLWLDELPMLINLLKGDLKLVGVRPLSKHYFDLYSEELKEKRIKYKPGLVPPFYADLPKTLSEIMESEMKYLESYEKNPKSTDFRYFFKAFGNILFRRARSK